MTDPTFDDLGEPAPALRLAADPRPFVDALTDVAIGIALGAALVAAAYVLSWWVAPPGMA